MNFNVYLTSRSTNKTKNAKNSFGPMFTKLYRAHVSALDETPYSSFTPKWFTITENGRQNVVDNVPSIALHTLS